MTTCLHCGAETSNGLALCDLSQTLAARVLDMLPVYFRNLARWRPGRAGSRPVPGSRVLYDGEVRASGDRIGRALDEAGTAIASWAECVRDDRGPALPEVADDEAQNVAALCRYLAGHLASIGTLEWAGEFVHQLASHEDVLRRLTEDAAPGWYAGGCKHCDSGTYVVPGLTWVRCQGCGVTTYARDHLDTILDEARDWVARPKALAEAIVALVDGEESVIRLNERIKKWTQRERLVAYRTVAINDFGAEVEIGPKRYRLGDVLDLVLRRADETAPSERIGA